MNLAFAQRLLDWYDRSRRDLPWRRTRDPYAIWISEIMLQQTRVTTVIPYYLRFIERLPTVDALAAASETELLSLWAGLGYYSRARNLQRAAREMNGRFPREYDAIRSVPGIGEYTAAAVSSIAYNEPYAAVDGNVSRVLSRVSASADDVRALAAELLDTRRPGDFNQAMMELGATICLPRDPQCLLCPVADLCSARLQGRQGEFPPKRTRPETIRMQRTLYILERDAAVLVWERPSRSRSLAGFWELPESEQLQRKPSRSRLLGKFRHSITHHEYTFIVRHARASGLSQPCKNVVNCRWIPLETVQTVVLSTVTRKALALFSSTAF
jgi:A/G-specific adenine glycosylase